MNFSKNEELIKTVQIENTPFTIVEDEKGKRICLGHYAVTDEGEQIQHLEIEIPKTDWKFMLNVMQVIVDVSLNQRELDARIRASQEATKEAK